MKCSVCGADNLEGAAYCEDCGARLSGGAPVASVPPPAPIQAIPVAPPAPAPPARQAGAVKCPACEAENTSGSAFCEECGASLGAPSAQPAAAAVAAPAAAPAGPRLEIGGKFFLLDKDEMTIGRKSPADGIFPDIDLSDDDPEAFISRRHGRVVKQGGEFIFEDTGSSNGSFVNDTRVNASVQHPLKEGDLLRLGKTELVFKT